MATLFGILVLVTCLILSIVECEIQRYEFNVVMTNTTRLCSSKPTVTVNGRFPGPTIYAREGDNVLVKVVNQVQYNMTIHWHGIRQLRTGWADGPDYITQCPIQPGQNYVYNFTITGQRGTLWWHAHLGWFRATVHGAIVILPELGVPYPFPTPDKEELIILAEWWKSDIEAMVDKAMKLGIAPEVSDAYTINGQTGPVSSCNSEEEFNLVVEPGKKYMLRIINAVLNEELFFKIAGHKLTVVEVDATYVKPFQTDTIVITPGQTVNVILEADRGTGKYLMAASPFIMEPYVPIDNTIAKATVQYFGTLSSATTTLTDLPAKNDSTAANSFFNSLKSLNSQEYPARVPLTVNHSLLFTIGLGFNPCSTCTKGVLLAGHFNNVSFVNPKISLLDAHFFNISGVFTDDFPANPLNPYDYTGNQPDNRRTMEGTKLYRLAYNSNVQIVLQGTNMVSPENHPIHLHGSNFFVVGIGMGNFNPEIDPNNFNLVDPVERNTVAVPSGGWAAIRFTADNPGVWFMHCHLEFHTSVGLAMPFVVDNGQGPNESLLPPPEDLPRC